MKKSAKSVEQSSANTTDAIANMVAFLRKNETIGKSRWIGQLFVINKSLIEFDDIFTCLKGLPITTHQPKFNNFKRFSIALMACKVDFDVAIIVREN